MSLLELKHAIGVSGKRLSGKTTFGQKSLCMTIAEQPRIKFAEQPEPMLTAYHHFFMHVRVEKPFLNPSAQKETIPEAPKHLIIVSGKRRSGKTTFAQTTFPGRPIICMLREQFGRISASDLPRGSVIEIQQAPRIIPRAWYDHILHVFVATNLQYGFVEQNI